MKISTPANLDEALRMMASEPTALTPVAGGTDLLVSWHHRPKDDAHFLDLTRVARELSEIRLSPVALELGAMTTYWDVMQSAEVAPAFPLLVEAARQVGALQIQTRGTWAGNIGNSSPAADGVPVLLAYDATVVLACTTGRREAPLDSYWTGYKQTIRRPDELIVAIRLPRRPRFVEWFHKVGARSAQTITKVGVAVVHDAAGWRIAANSVAPFVCRCRNLEAALAAGRTFASPTDLAAVLRDDVSPIDDLRSTAAYRLNVLARLLHTALAPPPAA